MKFNVIMLMLSQRFFMGYIRDTER